MSGDTTPEMHHKYNTSEKGRARQARYAASQKGMRRRRRYVLRTMLRLTKEELRGLQ